MDGLGDEGLDDGLGLTGIPPVGEGGGILPPLDGDGGGGRRDEPPRRDHRGFLPWLALGASIITFERLVMLTFVISGLGAIVYAAAAVVFLAVTVGGALVGARAFQQAYREDLSRG